MTRVKLTYQMYWTADFTRYTLTCEGHATGSAEMCAAISCLVYTAAGWLRNTEGATLIAEELTPGRAMLAFTGKDAGTLYDFLAVGFLQLEQHDPDHISVEVE